MTQGTDWLRTNYGAFWQAQTHADIYMMLLAQSQAMPAEYSAVVDKKFWNRF